MTAILIRHGMHVIRQPRGSNLCWAASVAMVMGGSTTITIVRSQAEAAGVRLNANGSLPSGDLPNVQRLASHFRLHVADVRTTPVTLESIRGWLRPGRFAMLGGFNYSGSMTALDHAVTFYAVEGDGTPRGTRVFLADPFNGLFRDDFEHFEEEVMADPHFVLHK
ncbi:MAG: hypothetical protein DCC68_14765 [Planctomycetota bacterium]|nr:MAG: hypothetical protein DCC68_14765 [Planctomycetota bacterium]